MTLAIAENVLRSRTNAEQVCLRSTAGRSVMAKMLIATAYAEMTISAFADLANVLLIMTWDNVTNDAEAANGKKNSSIFLVDNCSVCLAAC